MDYLAAPLAQVSQLRALFALDAWFHAAADLNKTGPWSSRRHDRSQSDQNGGFKII
jgi:hypothetical protein